MTDQNSGGDEEERKFPPVDGVEYPEKPGEDASMLEKMKYMERVDAYWQARGLQKLNHNEKDEESTNNQG